MPNKEIIATLEKPYTENQRIGFIVEYNHNQGCEIEELEDKTLQAFEIVKTDEEKEREERERIAKLSMTKREMFLGLYQAKGITPDMLKAQITDPQALIEFEYANDYYRGNPLIDVIGTQLGFTTEQLDRFFETKDYKELLPVEEETEDNGTGQASDASSNSPVVDNEVVDEDITDIVE